MCYMAIMFTGSVLGQQDSPPDPELLEFLADGVQLGTELVDPVSYSEIDEMIASQRGQQDKPGVENE